MPRTPKARRSFTEDGPNAVDVHVGARIRLRRTLQGLSQTELGEALGLTFQQIQKYEKGTNRVSASRLWQIAEVLDVPVSFFFDDLAPTFGTPGHTAAEPPGAAADEGAPMMSKRETLELVRAYYRISDPRVRRRLYEVVKAVGAGDPVTNAA